MSLPVELQNWISKLVEQEGSDLYLSTGAPPHVRLHGRMENLTDQKLLAGQIHTLALQIMTEVQQQEFKHTSEANFAISIQNIGRFRVNVFKQRGETGMVIRRIANVIPTPDSLGLPEVLRSLILIKRGLLLFVGATGAGKSTTMASLIDYRNTLADGHIITIEDPIEYTHRHKKSIINQREVGLDTATYESALKNALRQAPDVIQIGEIRSRDTMEHAIAFAETGHLCISTLHASNANQAITRIINFFPRDLQNQLLLDLSLNLRGIISQRLIPTIDQKRIAAIEILVNSPLISELIKRGEISEMKAIMERSENLGMQTFDTALFKLYQAGKISEEEALINADSQNNLRIKIAGHNGTTLGEDKTGLSMEQHEENMAQWKKINLPQSAKDKKS